MIGEGDLGRLARWKERSALDRLGANRRRGRRRDRGDGPRPGWSSSSGRSRRSGRQRSWWSSWWAWSSRSSLPQSCCCAGRAPRRRCSASARARASLSPGGGRARSPRARRLGGAAPSPSRGCEPLSPPRRAASGASSRPCMICARRSRSSLTVAAAAWRGPGGGRSDLEVVLGGGRVFRDRRGLQAHSCSASERRTTPPGFARPGSRRASCRGSGCTSGRELARAGRAGHACSPSRARPARLARFCGAPGRRTRAHHILGHPCSTARRWRAEFASRTDWTSACFSSEITFFCDGGRRASSLLDGER